MYERMLDRQTEPTIGEMTEYCGDNAQRFTALNEWLTATFGTEQKIVFPYGNQYGWGVSHHRKKKLLCNVFAENGAFTVMLRLTDGEFQAGYERVEEYMKGLIDSRYPCGNGGWIHCRVTSPEILEDVKTLLSLKGAKQPHSTLREKSIKS